MNDNPIKEGVIRTPDERFENLPGYNFKANYITIDGLRMHYLNEGPVDANPVLLLHGDPSWSYLYRKMIPPLVDAGHRVIAPDLIGFGRSDKYLSRGKYSYQMQVDMMVEFVRKIGLERITLFVQDWGGLIGLRALAVEPHRYDRIIVSNTGLPDADGIMGYLGKYLFKLKVWSEGNVSLGDSWEGITLTQWVAYSRRAKEFPIGTILQKATVNELSPEILRAYEAPFLNDDYKVAARVMPSLIPTQLRENNRAWKQVLEKWEKPLLTAFSDSDPITRGGESVFLKRVPGAKAHAHIKIKGAGHFVQEDKGEELAQVIIDFIEKTT